ncbi:MAG: segregation and condensation protein [Candidatus Parcubacteria bacterium]|jgi:segregation and condensation protein A|nr:segregation and condensation protein [Candidatus Parcubacteria bacterium]
MEPVAQKAFTVRAGEYEGPLEVLLDLIERRKLLVNELSLSQVTDDFIAFIRSSDEFPIEDAANFVAVAATLLLIKSRSLIPEVELSGEEEEDIDDLKRRLEAYERARSAARELGRIFGRSVMLPAGERRPEPMFAPSKDLDLERLAKALEEALASREVQEKLPEARVRPMISIEEMMDSLHERVQKALTLKFSDFAGDTRERIEVIVSFLALLELVKQGAVEADQQGAFKDIQITNATASVPRY